MAKEDLKRYLMDITSQHNTKPKYMAHLTKILEKIDGAHGAMKDIPDRYVLKTAVGEQLDVLAKFADVTRYFPQVNIPGYNPVLDDDNFRLVIMAKTAQNHWDGTNETFHQIWKDALDGLLDAHCIDNQDMSMDVIIIGPVDPIITELVLIGDIIPKPVGVRLNTEITQEVIADAEAAFPATIGADFEYNSAEIGLYHPRGTVETSTSMMTGCIFPHNAAEVLIPPPRTSEQQASDSVFTGAAVPGNNACITVTMI